MVRRVRQCVVVAACVIAACLPCVASAWATSDTVIGFDDLGPGTVVAGQYQSSGLELGTATGFGLTSPGAGDCGSPTVQTGGAPAFSGANYAELPDCTQAGGVATYFSGTYGALQNYPRGSVSVDVRELSVGAPAIGMSITGYDASGNVVASGSATAASDAWALLTASQTSGHPVPAQISYVLIKTSTGATTLGAAPGIAGRGALARLRATAPVVVVSCSRGNAGSLVIAILAAVGALGLWTLAQRNKITAADLDRTSITPEIEAERAERPERPEALAGATA
jgi:hypothetical protein